MQQSAVPRLFLVSLFPLWDSVSSGAISPAAACHSVLQCPGGMPEQSLILCAFCTSVKTDRALVNRPIHDLKFYDDLLARRSWPECALKCIKSPPLARPQCKKNRAAMAAAPRLIAIQFG